MIVCLQWDFSLHIILFSLTTVGTTAIAHWAPTPNALTIFVVLLKVLIKLFQKFADSKGGALAASAEAKLLLRHFLFAKLFLLGLLHQKKKRRTI